MVEFLRTYQTDIMLVLSGISGMTAFFASRTRYPSKTRKTAQLVMALSSMVLLITEIIGEAYYGVKTPAGYWIVRISNFFVYLTTLLVIFAFNMYLTDMFQVDLKLPVPKRLRFISRLTIAGGVLVIISMFTGLYFTFDEQNLYHRSDLYPISYIIPLFSILLLLSVILEYRKKMRHKVWIGLLLFTAIPLAASIIQYFVYGIYLTDMAIVGMVILLYAITLADTNRMIEEGQRREIQLLKEEQEHVQKLFTETAIALVDAIDAKDAYTHGHSARVADYSKKIATLSWKSEKECNTVYYAALLHDVGKIGIPDAIINKEGKLTPEEYEVIKSHPVIGSQILSEISDFPNLSIAARYHHEHFDGKGYPEGLKEQDIPELARIVSVADAYDAMTSNRSYRRHQPQEKVREELIRCSGSQFDPAFAQIMIRLIDQDKNYAMHEH